MQGETIKGTSPSNGIVIQQRKERRKIAETHCLAQNHPGMG